MRIRMLFAAAAVVACFVIMPHASEAGGRAVYRAPFAYVGPAPVYAVPAPVNTAYYAPAMTAYYTPALVPAPVVPAPVYYQPAPVYVQPVTTYYAPATTYYAPRKVVYKTRGPRFLAPNYKTVVKYR